MKRCSLSMRLYRRVLLLLGLTGIAMAAILYTVAQREMAHAADRQLANASRMLYMLMQDELAAGIMMTHSRPSRAVADPLLTAEDQRAFHASFDWCMFVVFWDGRPIARSSWGAPTGDLPRRSGLHDFTAQGDRWRSYGLQGTNGKLLIVVAERAALRNIALGPVARQLALPLVLLLLAGVGMLWLTLRQGLSEVSRLAASVGTRTLADLTPLDRADWSNDLGPLIVGLNTLFARLDQAYELEQAFTDDVAHELRTPLSAVRAQAQVLGKTAPAPLRAEVDRLIAIVDRANGLIAGMLTLARLDATSIRPRRIDVHGLVAEVVAEHLLNLPPDSVDFAVTPDHPVRWRTDPALLKIALSSVVDNAVRHAREGRHIDIRLMPDQASLDIAVGDRGRGIPVPDRERLLRRFERGSSAMPGSGLGLSIAMRAMTLAGGTVLLDDRDDGPGLLVTLRLPAAE